MLGPFLGNFFFKKLHGLVLLHCRWHPNLLGNAWEELD